MNAIGTQLRDPMAYGGFIWTPPRNSGGIPQVSTRFSLSMEMSRLTRDGTAEPVSRDQNLRHARGQRNVHFAVQLTTRRIGNLNRLIHTLLYVMTIHTLVVLLGSSMMAALTCGTHCTVDRDSSVRAGMNPANSN